MDSEVEKKRITWGPLASVLVTIGIYFIAQAAAAVLLALYPATKHWGESQTNDWYNNSIYPQFGFGLLTDLISLQLLWWFLKHHRANFLVLGLKWPRFRDIGYAFYGYLIYFATYIVAFAVINNYTAVNVDQKQELGFDMVGNKPSELVFVFVSLVILPPIIEEILTRGFLFGGLRSKFSFIKAALVTSLIFGVAHLQLGSGNPPLYIAAVDTFIMSLVLCHIREKTGSLAGSMLMHATKNAIAFAGLFIFHWS